MNNHEGFTAYAELDKAGFITNCNQWILDKLGVDEMHRDLHMGIEYFPNVNEDQYDSWSAVAFNCLETGNSSQFSGNGKYTKAGNDKGHIWVRAQGMFTRKDDGLIMRVSTMNLNDFYFGYPDRLNQSGRLVLSKDVSLSPIELAILHYYITGSSAKQTAPRVFRSVKAVEASIRRIKEKLYLHSHPELSLTQNLNHRNMIGFIAAQPNWGDEIYRTQFNLIK